MPADTPQTAGGAMKDIHDIRPPVPMGSGIPWEWIVPILAGALLLAAIVYWYVKRKKKSKRIETVAAELLPEEVARQSLKALSDVYSLDPKTFYFRLSEVMRQYIDGRFGMGAFEMTTEEFVSRIDELDIDAELSWQLKRLSRQSDPVKFGGEPAAPDRMAGDLAFAEMFVDKTTETVLPGNQ